MNSSKIMEVTDSEYNIRTSAYQLNKVILVTLYSTDIIKQMAEKTHLNKVLISGLPQEIEFGIFMLQTNRGDRFNVRIAGGIVTIDYVYNFSEVNYTQIAQQFMYICK